MFTTLAFIAGIVIGVIFNNSLRKYYAKAKEAGKEVASDLKKDAEQLKSKP